MAAKQNPILDEMHRLEASGSIVTSIQRVGAYPHFVARFRLKGATSCDLKVDADAPYFGKWCLEATRVLGVRRQHQLDLDHVEYGK